MFAGSFTALITPFDADGIDEAALAALIEWQIAEGSDGLVPCGTTGESPTLNRREHGRVVALCVEVAAGRVPVIAGAGSRSTAVAIELAEEARALGADAALVVTPYYNKPTQDGLYRHYAAIAGAVDLPIMIYNIPARSAVDMSVETMAQLAALPNIIGVKDATSDIARISRQRLAMGTDFLQFSGEDATALAVMAHGGHGCISVTANIAPRACADFQSACRAGDFTAARAIQDRLMPLHDALFAETSPGPVKYAASVLGLCGPEVRLPLAPVTEVTQARIQHAMAIAGLAGPG